jgi:hypothetical protein
MGRENQHSSHEPAVERQIVFNYQTFSNLFGAYRERLLSHPFVDIIGYTLPHPRSRHLTLFFSPV